MENNPVAITIFEPVLAALKGDMTQAALFGLIWFMAGRDSDGVCYASNDTLAEAMHCSSRTIERQAPRLIEAGLIIDLNPEAKERRQTHCYQLTEAGAALIPESWDNGSHKNKRQDVATGTNLNGRQDVANEPIPDIIISDKMSYRQPDKRQDVGSEAPISDKMSAIEPVIKNKRQDVALSNKEPLIESIKPLGGSLKVSFLKTLAHVRIPEILEVLDRFRIRVPGDDRPEFDAIIAGIIIPSGEDFNAWLGYAADLTTAKGSIKWQAVAAILVGIQTVGTLAEYERQNPLPTIVEQGAIDIVKAVCRMKFLKSRGEKYEEVLRVCRELQAAGLTIVDVQEFGVWWDGVWWLGQKGQSPKPQQILDQWGDFDAYKQSGGKIINGRTDHTQNGNGKSDPTQRLTADQLATIQRVTAERQRKRDGHVS